MLFRSPDDRRRRRVKYGADRRQVAHELTELIARHVELDDVHVDDHRAAVVAQRPVDRQVVEVEKLALADVVREVDDARIVDGAGAEFEGLGAVVLVDIGDDRQLALGAQALGEGIRQKLGELRDEGLLERDLDRLARRDRPLDLARDEVLADLPAGADRAKIGGALVLDRASREQQHRCG